MSMFMRADKQERSGKAEMRTAKTFYAASLFFETLQNFNDVRLDVQQKQKYAAWRAAEIYKKLKGKAQRVLKEASQLSSGLPASDKTLSVWNDEFRSSMLKPDKSVADPLEMRFPPDECSAVGPEMDAGQEQFPYITSDSSIIFGTVPTSSITTSNLEKEEETDDDQSFYDCSDADLSALSSSDSEHESDHTSDVTADAADESYHPSAGDISKAQKVARLAVSALAFDNVESAVSYLEQALDLLTNNSPKEE